MGVRRSDVMALGVIVGGAGLGLMATSQLLSARTAGPVDSIRHESRVIRISAPTVETVVTMVCEDEDFVRINLDGLNDALREMRVRMASLQEARLEHALESEIHEVSTEIETGLRAELERIERDADVSRSELAEELSAVAEARARSLQTSVRRIALNRNHELATEIQEQLQSQFALQARALQTLDLASLQADSDGKRKCKRRRRHRRPHRVTVSVNRLDRP